MNQDKKREKIKKMIDAAGDSYSYLSAAESIIEDLDDKVWGRKIYKIALEEAEDTNEFRNIANSIIKYLDDKDWAKEAYIIAIDKSKTAKHYANLASDICCCMQDKEWGKKIYQIAVDKIEADKDYCDLARDISYNLDDDEWVQEVRKKGYYALRPLSGPFGYMREGNGTVVYLMNSETNYSAIEQFTDHIYNTIVEYDGEDVIDFAEYDELCFHSSLCDEIMEEMSFDEVVECIGGTNSGQEKFELFLKTDVLNKNIPLIFIDKVKKEISQIVNVDDLHKIIKQYDDNLIIYIKQYDHVYDY